VVKQFNKAKVSITLDQDVYDAIVVIAEKDDRTVSAMINKILRDFVKGEKEGD
jgi:hypothetical protein